MRPNRYWQVVFFFEATIANYITVTDAGLFLEGPLRIRLQLQLQDSFSLEGSIRKRLQLICLFFLDIRQHSHNQLRKDDNPPLNNRHATTPHKQRQTPQQTPQTTTTHKHTPTHTTPHQHTHHTSFLVVFSRIHAELLIAFLVTNRHILEHTQ